ncbi:hypothetical protein TeGR_g2874 [Tetraparma gracilis]|uniref:Uncharacterized protein n=1 Tax=Tetraparma gracilis TaxID=2962635 RepID=A0ABQ6MF63_9STRA|nr:hypothetical protein TeGR_g2874 [Tetraparma gracilis]
MWDTGPEFLRILIAAGATVSEAELIGKKCLIPPKKRWGNKSYLVTVEAPTEGEPGKLDLVPADGTWVVAVERKEVVEWVGAYKA